MIRMTPRVRHASRCTAALAGVASAQQPGRVRRIGILSGNENEPQTLSRIQSFKQALAASGWFEGRNLRIDTRLTDSDPVRARANAAELVGLEPEVILSATPGLPPFRALLTGENSWGTLSPAGQGGGAR